MMPSARCEKCGANLEKRTVEIGGSYAPRLVCSDCSATYQVDQVCQVCRTARASARLDTTVYRSSILGTHQISHCPNCRPPSKLQLEFQTAPIAALIKYGLAAGCLITTLIVILAAIFSGGNH